MVDAAATLEAGVTSVQAATDVLTQQANNTLWTTYSTAYDTLEAAWSAVDDDQALKDQVIVDYNAMMDVAVAQWQTAFDAAEAAAQPQLAVLATNFATATATATRVREVAVNPFYATYLAAVQPAGDAYVTPNRPRGTLTLTSTPGFVLTSGRRRPSHAVFARTSRSCSGNN